MEEDSPRMFHLSFKDAEEELSHLKEKLREYLTYPSSDGKSVRKKLREELEELTK